MTMKVDHRITQALTTVVAMCVGVRLAWRLIAPLWPALVVLFAVVAILVIATKGR